MTTFQVPGKQSGVGGAFQLGILVVIHLKPRVERKHRALISHESSIWVPTCKEVGLEVFQGLSFLASLPPSLPGTGKREGGDKTQFFQQL